MNKSLFDKINVNKNKSIFENIEKSEGDVFEQVSKNKKEEIEDSDLNIELLPLSGLFLSKNNVAIPHYFSRSAIYAPRRADRDRSERNTNIPVWSQGKMGVFYQGPELDTKIDYRLMSILMKARDNQNANDHIVRLKYKETMEALQLNPKHPDARKKFHASIERHLSARFYFMLDNEKEGFWKSFFETEHTNYSYSKNELNIQVSDLIPKLFKYNDTGSFSIEDMLISFAIKDSYASKLYSYYESNGVPFPIKISTLLEICDHPLSENEKPTNNHRTTIKKALSELVELGFLEKWMFDDAKDKRDPLVVVYKVDRLKRVIPQKIEFNVDFIQDK